jgi:branched-chain amino acid transport system substrate-binding protein
MSRLRRSALTLVAAGVAALVVAACGSSSSSSSSSSTSSSAGKSSSKAPIVIGAAIDFSSLMAPTDDPAFYAAELEAKKINAEGGVDGRKIEFLSANTQNQPSLTRSDALNFIAKKVNVLWVTCDVDFGTPSIEVGLAAGLLTVSPCIGTDQMGPQRFGSAGKLAFTYGNVAQDEGAADARIAIKQGWKTADVITDKQIAFNVDTCEAFISEYQALGGRVIYKRAWVQGDHTIGSIASQVLGTKPAVMYACTTGSPDISTFLTDVRSAGNMTPMLADWALDGTWWMPKNPSVATNVWTDSYASIYGDDPSPDIRQLVSELTAEGHPPTTGGFAPGAAAVDGIVAAIKQAGGSTDGKTLASIMQSFHGLPTVSGPVSFSPQLHAVYGRPYRVLEVVHRQGHFKYLISSGGLAKCPPITAAPSASCPSIG